MTMTDMRHCNLGPPAQDMQAARADRPPRRHTALILLPVVVPVLCLVATGVWSIDYGRHWDEPLHADAVKRTVERGVLLPGMYYYPSMCYWFSLAAVVPDLLHAAISPARTLPRSHEDWMAIVGSPDFLLEIRTVFLCVSALTIVWIYLLALSLRGSWIEALLAACFFALSWEVSYHARWVAPDGIMTQFGALTLLCISRVLRARRPIPWLYAAAVAAALTCGTKYQGGLFLLGVLLVAVLACRRQQTQGPKLRPLLARLGLIFAVTFLFTTPGMLLEPLEFCRHAGYMVLHYASYEHSGYNVARGWPHLRMACTYLGASFFSPSTILSLATMALALIGLLGFCRKQRSDALLLLAVPALYLLYMSLQGIMIVRNLLVLTPVLAILAARGAAMLWRLHPGPVLRLPLATAIALLIAFNAYWQFHAAGTVVDRRSDRFVRELADYLNRRPDTRYYVSPRVAARLADLGLAPPENTTSDPSSDSQKLVLYASEAKRFTPRWPANDPRLTETWFGPREVNYDYYASWWGDDRILVMAPEKARQIRMQIPPNRELTVNDPATAASRVQP